jgi:hypothetical protein
MDTVTAKPAFGSVDHFVDVLRKYHNLRDLNSALVAVLDTVSDPRFYSATVAMRQVRNCLAAGEQVRSEIQAADR